jgi:hypothetical protein
MVLRLRYETSLRKTTGKYKLNLYIGAKKLTIKAFVTGTYHFAPNPVHIYELTITFIIVSKQAFLYKRIYIYIFPFNYIYIRVNALVRTCGFGRKPIVILTISLTSF